MPVSLPLETMSTEEKIEVMELLWADLVETAGSTLSPEWHGEVLAAREAAFASGDEESIEWEAMKQEIYEELK